MPNIPALVGLVQTLVRPGLIVPHAVVREISALDWTALHRAGVRHVVCDKDNCLTKPHEDVLAPMLTESWEQCRRTFGAENLLIVSNSAGSSNDSSGIGAESLSRELQVPVLAHPAKKPARSCAKQIIDYLDPKGHILVIGDRPTTDIVLAYRIDTLLRSRKGTDEAGEKVDHPRSTITAGAALAEASASLLGTSSVTHPRAFGILTTNLWAPEQIGTRSMRAIENAALRLLARRNIAPGAGWGKGSLERQTPPEWLSVAFSKPTTSDASLPRLSVAPLKSDDSQRLLALLVAQPALPSWFRTSLRGMLAVVRTKPAMWLSRQLLRGWHMAGEGVAIGTDARLRRGALLSSLPLPSRGRILGTPKSSRGYATSAKSPPPSATSAPRPDVITSPSSVQAKPSATGVPPHRASWQNWRMALLALAIIPTGWYAGLVLNEKLADAKEAPDIQHVVEELVPQVSLKPSQSTHVEGATEREKREHVAALEREAFHLARELKEVREKQERLKSNVPGGTKPV